MSDYLDINNEELLKDFFSEAEMQVEQLESNILVIENDPANHDAIDEIFRAAHTLKGGAATVEMMELASFTHVVEDLLDEIRNGSVAVTEDVIDVLLDSIDVIKAMLEKRSNGEVYQEDVSGLEERLKSFVGEKKPAKKSPPPVMPALEKKSVPVNSDSGESPFKSLSEYDMLELTEALEPGEKLYCVSVKFDESNPMNSVGGIQAFAALKDLGRVLKTNPDFESLYEDNFYPVVQYFFAASNTDIEAIKKAVDISDVTLGEAAVFTPDTTAGDAGTPARKAKAEPVAEAAKEPAREPAQAAETAASLVASKPSPEKEEKKNTGAGAQQHSNNSVLRVDSRRIDYLLNLVSEIVISKASFNQTTMLFGGLQNKLAGTLSLFREKVKALTDVAFEHIDMSQDVLTGNTAKKDITQAASELFGLFDDFSSEFKETVSKFRSGAQNLGRITGELQEGVLKIRMVPISQIFSRFPRVVRDLSKELNKKIRLEIEGEDTELDKSVTEDLFDPIMHCVRNSVDHGIESPENRVAAGKPEEGRVLLKASNEGNLIIIEISDDGTGIDVESVRKKAVERGIIHATKMISDSEAYQLIFEPGFSTSDKITNISGRGVGLDVVKTQVEKINGTVSVQSERGVGSRFVIKLPLTLAIIQGLLVKVENEIYSIPIASVIESHRVNVKDIKMIDNYEVFNVREEVVSILRLDRIFGIKRENSEVNSEYRFIVVVGTNEKKVGLMVDSLIGEEDVVIKPLKDQFTNSPGIAGASILGDGSVSLIIDVSQLLELGLRQEKQTRSYLAEYKSGV